MAEIGTVILDVDSNNPAAESTDYQAMKADWTLIADIRAGARRVKEKKNLYLPQYEKESDSAYALRLAAAPWRPEFVDALQNLCSKPFTKEAKVGEGAPDIIVGTVVDEKTKRREGGIVADIDGQGNSLHVFSRETFKNGVAQGLAAVLVDYPTMTPGLTLADERASGARPYWVQIPAEQIIALYFRVDNGRLIVEHIRIRECAIERVGFAETLVDRVRVFELDEAGKPVWQLWQAVETDGSKKGWELTAQGSITLPEIPIALYFTGERSSNYCVKPPLIDLAVMQMELYRGLSRKDEILTYAGSPMLKGTGMNPPEATPTASGDAPAPQITVGPKTILFAPPAMNGVQPDWDFIQPNADNIRAVIEDANGVTADMRRLGLQPTTQNSGDITATAAAINAAKAHSAVEMWALGLKDVLEQAMKYTGQWLGIADTITVNVHTDFGGGVQGTEEATVIGNAQGRGVISAKTEREELARRGILGPQFDEGEEEQRLAEEQQGLAAEQPIDPITGQPVNMPGQPASQ